MDDYRTPRQRASYYLAQPVAAIAAGSAIIALGITSPAMIAGNSLLGAIGATWALNKLFDRRNHRRSANSQADDGV